MAIQNGQTPDANEVLNAIGSNFNDTAQMIFNADYIGFDSRLNNNSAPVLKNVDYDTFRGDSADSSNTTMEYDSVDDLYLAGEIYDVYNSVVDAAKWEDLGSDSGTLSETTEFIQDTVTDDTPNITLSAKAVDVKPGTGDDGEFFLTVKFTTTKASGSNDVIFDLLMRDESANEIVLKTFNQASADTSNTAIFKVILSTNNAQVRYNVTGGFSTSGTDGVNTSSLVGSNWHLRFKCRTTDSTAGNTATIQVFNIIQATYTNVSSKILQTDVAETASSTITNAIPIINNSDNGTFVYQLSADNGSNFESVTNQEIHRFSNTGTQLINKISVSGSNLIALPFVSEYATKYNFY